MEQIVKDGVQYEVSENVTILEEENKVFLLNEKHKVPVPDKFSEVTKYTFNQKIVSFNLIKGEFKDLPNKEILEFLQAMKNMKVFS